MKFLSEDEMQIFLKRAKSITAKKPKILLFEEEYSYQIWAEQDFLNLMGSGINIVRCVRAIFDRADGEYKADSELYIFYDTSGKELYRGRNKEGLEKNIKEFFKEMHMQKELDNFERNEYFYSLNNGAFISEKVLNSRNYCVVKHIDI